MARFQLVFRHPDGDRIELRANNVHEQPEIDGKIVAGLIDLV
jgi:hypothetical protein